jgi:hypothetical protein
MKTVNVEVKELKNLIGEVKRFRKFADRSADKTDEVDTKFYDLSIDRLRSAMGNAAADLDELAAMFRDVEVWLEEMLTPAGVATKTKKRKACKGRG